MTAEDTATRLRRATTSKNSDLLRQLARTAHPHDVADALAELPEHDLVALLLAQPAEERAQVFSYLPREGRQEVIEKLERAQLVELFEYLDADERADAFGLLETQVRQQVLAALSPADRRDVETLVAYSPGSVGSVMTSELARLTPNMSVTEAMAHLRAEAPNKEVIYVAFVSDASGKLVGYLTLRDLILGEPNQPLAELMRHEPITVKATAHRSEAVRLIKDYDLLALPVVDDDDRLVGLVTHDDAMDVAEAEATEDILKVAGIEGPRDPDGPLALEFDLRNVRLTTLFRKRIVWLIALVFGNVFSGAGIAAFEDLIAANVTLMFFLPLLIGSSGNAGSQSATLMVRSLATGDVKVRDWLTLLSREFAVAAMLGLAMGAAVSVLGLLRSGPQVAMIVTLTMVLVVVVGSLVGMCLPFVLSRLRLDPATASAPLVTTIADAAGVVIYFSVATLLLS